MMNNKKCIGLVALMGLMVLSGCGQGPHTESSGERLARWRREFKASAAATASNEVVGITRIVNIDTVDFEEDFHKWTGRILAEHVNKVGGIEREELLVKAHTTLADGAGQSHIYTVVDRQAMFQERLERLKPTEQR